MKRARPEPEEMLPEYDFSNGVRGKYASRFANGTVMVVLDPDVAELFPVFRGNGNLDPYFVGWTPDGAVGITFLDNSMMSLGPDSTLALDQFRFDSTTHDGVFESSLKRGTLAVKSGYIVQQTPEAMRVRTPAAILGVRGTEFVVRAEAGP